MICYFSVAKTEISQEREREREREREMARKARESIERLHPLSIQSYKRTSLHTILQTDISPYNLTNGHMTLTDIFAGHFSQCD
jgi:hypothetical protein